jgi:tetratricopeptide (TPR) repeat protein
MAAAHGDPATDPATRGGWLAVAAVTAIVALGYDPLAPASAPKRVALIAAGIAAVVLALRRLLRARDLPAASLAWLGLGLWSALGLAWAPARSLEAIERASGWLGAGALMMAASRLAPRSLERGARLGALFAGGGAAAACLASAAAGAGGMELHGLQGNPNWLGLLIACALPLELEALAVAWRARSRARALPLAAIVIATAASVAALALARSLVAWVALGAVALVLGRGRWRALGALPSLGALALAAAGGSLASSLDGRLWIWGASARAAAAALPIGCGAGCFVPSFLDAQGSALATLPPEQAVRRFVFATSAHGDWLQLSVEGGLPAVALALAALASMVACLRKRWPAGAASALTAAVCALGDAPLELPAVLALLVPVAAAADAHARAGERTLARPRRTMAAIAAATALAAPALLLPQALAGWIAARRVTEAEDRAPDERIAALAHARALAPRSGRVALALGLAQLDASDARAAWQTLAHARRLAPSLAAEVAAGNAALALGDPQAATACYARALGWHPAHFRALINLAEALRTAGDLAAARGALARARALQPHHPKLARLAALLERQALDAATAGAASGNAPEDPLPGERATRSDRAR